MQEAISEDERSFEQKVEEELANMDPAVLEYLEQLLAVEEELVKLDPAVVEYLTQLVAENVPAARKFIQNIQAKMDPTADKRKTPYCKKHGSTNVLWHEHENTNLTDDSCELRGYCYPCIRKGVYTRAYYPGTVPPRANKIKCTNAFHDYLYWVDLSDDDFLEHRTPEQITEKEANFLSKQVPEYEKKGEAIYLYP